MIIQTSRSMNAQGKEIVKMISNVGGNIIETRYQRASTGWARYYFTKSKKTSV